MARKTLKQRFSNFIGSEEEPSTDNSNKIPPAAEDKDEKEDQNQISPEEEIRQLKTQVEVLRQTLNKNVDIVRQTHLLSEYNAKTMRLVIDHYDHVVNRINRIRHDPGHWALKIIFFCLTTIGVGLSFMRVLLMFTSSIAILGGVGAILAALGITVIAYVTLYYIGQKQEYDHHCEFKPDTDNPMLGEYLDHDLSFMGSSNFYKDFILAGDEPKLRRNRTDSLDFAERATSPDAFFYSPTREVEREKYEEKEAMLQQQETEAVKQ